MKRLALKILFTLLFAALPLQTWGSEPPGPQVVVSINPLHSLVAGVMEGIGEPDLLIEGGGSPHGYALRPSEARLLAEARLVVWVGPGLESFLEKSLSTLAADARRLTLAEALESDLLPLREGGRWEAHEHAGPETEHHHHSGDAHDQEHHGAYNPHLWLDPLLAKKIVDETTDALAEIDPAHRERYRKNAASLHGRLDALHARLKAKFAPVKDVPYVVFHDAYPYFEAAYDLGAAGSITLDPERRPGARRVREIRETIRELGARCVFSEPQFEPRLVATVVEGMEARAGVLDPLGADLPPGPDAYFLLLNALADELVSCLGEKN